MNYEGSPIKETLKTLKISVQLTVSLGGSLKLYDLWSLRLKGGSEPVHISGQHLGTVEKDTDSKYQDEEVVTLLSISGKRFAPGSSNKVPQKRRK